MFGICWITVGHGSEAGQDVCNKRGLLTGLKVKTVHPFPARCSTLVCLPDVSGIDEFQVLGQTEVLIQLSWKNPPAEVDYFRLTTTDPTGQEEEVSVQRSQEAHTKYTIVGQLHNQLN